MAGNKFIGDDQVTIGLQGLRYIVKVDYMGNASLFISGGNIKEQKARQGTRRKKTETPFMIRSKTNLREKIIDFLLDVAFLLMMIPLIIAGVFLTIWNDLSGRSLR